MKIGLFPMMLYSWSITKTIVIQNAYLQDLLSYSLDELYLLWDSIQAHSEVRQTWITELDDSLKKAEDDRMEMV
jgi:hypothetical protein